MNRAKRIYIIITVALSYLLLAGMNIGYTTWVDHKRAANERESDQQWCDIINYYVALYDNNPPNPASPNYEVSKRNSELMHERQKTLGCKTNK